MQKPQVHAVAVALALVGMHFGCSSGSGATNNVNSDNGGTTNTSGTTTATSGGVGTTASASNPEPSGGAITAGGSLNGSSSTQRDAGGAQSSSAMGGASATVTTRSAGGASATTSSRNGFGGTVSSGGAVATSSSSVSSGGSATPASGTVSSGGAASGGSTAIDPNVTAAINACIDKLPYGGRDLSSEKRAPIITAIINACRMFAPPGDEWQTYCQMFLVGAINAESSFNAQAGLQGASNDPSVGLLQIRFSSVVRDIANYGPTATLERNGCAFGKVTDSDSFATKQDMMLDVNCNVAIATWYYFIFGSGNGGPTVVWVEDYCTGGGVTGNLHIGMASFLMGGDAAHQSLSGADFYYNEIKGWFDPCVTYSGTHPFELPIKPDIRKYCR